MRGRAQDRGESGPTLSPLVRQPPACCGGYDVISIQPAAAPVYEVGAGLAPRLRQLAAYGLPLRRRQVCVPVGRPVPA